MIDAIAFVENGLLTGESKGFHTCSRAGLGTYSLVLDDPPSQNSQWRISSPYQEVVLKMTREGNVLTIHAMRHGALADIGQFTVTLLGFS